MDIDRNSPLPSSSSSSTSSSTPIREQSRRFKLDPMSLLLPHERESYQQQQKEQQRTIREQQKKQHQQQQQLVQQQQAQRHGQDGKGFYSGSGHQAWEASVRSTTAPAAGGKGTRQTSSMGDQSGKQGVERELSLQSSF